MQDEENSVNSNAWDKYMREYNEEYDWEDENEERLWYCEHGKAYGVRCRRCDEGDD